MNCLECDEILQQRLDGAVESVNDDVAKHLSECSRCRELHRASRLLETGIQALSQPVPSLPLHQRIVTQVLSDRLGHLRWYRRIVPWAAAAAAFIAVPLLSYWLWPFVIPVRVEQKQSIVEAPSEKPGADVLPSELRTLRSRVEEARHAVISLTGRIAADTRKQAEIFWTVAGTDSLPPMKATSPAEVPIEPAASSLKKATSEVSEGFLVVAATTRRAVDYFAKGIPNLESQK